MKSLAIFVVALSVLTACTPPLETRKADLEFGEATRHSLDSQIAYPDYRYADQTPQTLPGINAEEIMNVHNQTFAEEPQRANILNMGLLQ